MTLPLCVACKHRLRDTWNGRRDGRPPALRTARYLVYVGASQVERFECPRCQAATQNRIVVDLTPDAQGTP
jgi:hypothetical protein